MVAGLQAAGCTSGSGNGTYNTVWLDIEGDNKDKTWSSDPAFNQKFFQSLLDGCTAAGVNCAVYTSASQWQPIMGIAYSGGAALPLWYAHYDNQTTFSDFKPFSGWTKPVIKQYAGDVTVCGLDVDVNVKAT